MTKVPQIDSDENRQGSATEMILVPRIPTKEMLEAAWAYALDEDAAGVWKAMIEVWSQDKSGNSDNGSG